MELFCGDVALRCVDFFFELRIVDCLFQSMLVSGALITSPLSGLVADGYGRRNAQIVCAVLALIGSLIEVGY